MWLYVRKLFLYNNDGISVCYVIALFHLAFPFCYSLHNISVRKPFDMSNDTKKTTTKEKCGVHGSVELILSPHDKNAHTYTRAALSHKNFHMHERSHTLV